MNQPEVVMIGLGYIGLPTAALIAKNKTALQPTTAQLVNSMQVSFQQQIAIFATH